MEEKINNNKFFVVQEFMIKELNLKGNELFIYAIIYNVSQFDQTYRNGLSCLMKWTSSTKQGVLKNLKSLVDKGYIIKNEYKINNVKYCEYYASVCGKLSLPPSQQSLPPSQLSLPPQEDVQPYYSNNINNYSSISHKTNLSINKNIEKENKKRDTINKLLYLEKKQRNFIKPTIDEIRQYIYERNSSIDAECFYNYYESNGWKVGRNPMKDWKACIRTWERNDILRNKKNNNNGVVYEQI